MSSPSLSLADAPPRLGPAIRVPNPYRCPSLRCSGNDVTWWNSRSMGMKVIMVFQCLLKFYMWDDDAPAMDISGLVVMLDINCKGNKGWMDGIKAKWLKHPVGSGNTVRPIDVIMRLLGCWDSTHQHWPQSLIFADTVPVPSFHIRACDTSSAGIAAMAAWRPLLLDPTFIPVCQDFPTRHIDIIIDEINHVIADLHTCSIRNASTLETHRIRAIADDLWRVNNHDYGQPPQAHQPRPYISRSNKIPTKARQSQSHIVILPIHTLVKHKHSSVSGAECATTTTSSSATGLSAFKRRLSPPPSPTMLHFDTPSKKTRIIQPTSSNDKRTQPTVGVSSPSRPYHQSIKLPSSSPSTVIHQQTTVSSILSPSPSFSAGPVHVSMSQPAQPQSHISI